MKNMLILFMTILLSFTIARPNGSPICDIPQSKTDLNGQMQERMFMSISPGPEATVNVTPFQAQAGEELVVKLESTQTLLGFLVNMEINDQPAGEFVHDTEVSQAPMMCTGANLKSSATHTKLGTGFDVRLTYKVPMTATGMLNIKVAVLVGMTLQKASQTFYIYNKMVSVVAAPMPTPAPVPTPVGPPAADVVIARGSAWSYWNTGVADPAWMGASFDASSWPQGNTPVGYGDVNFQYNTEFPEIVPEAAYFRTKVSVTSEQIAQHTQYTLRVCANGRAKVNFNGNKVQEMETDTVARYWNIDEFRPIDDFIAGDNVITVQVFNDMSSEDLVFDMEVLFGQHTPAPTPMPPTPPPPTPAAGGASCGDGRLEPPEQCESSSGACCVMCRWVDAGTSCDDGNAMTSNDKCDAVHKCHGLYTGPCTGDAQCDVDKSPCTRDVCTNSQCVRMGIALVGDPCDDGDSCTNDDACTTAGVCVGLPMTPCDSSLDPNDPSGLGWQQDPNCPIGEVGCPCTLIGRTCDNGVLCNRKNICGATTAGVGALAALLALLLPLLWQ